MFAVFNCGDFIGMVSRQYIVGDDVPKGLLILFIFTVCFWYIEQLREV